MKGNIPNHPNYHITKDGRLFSNKSGEWVEVNSIGKLVNSIQCMVK